MNYTVFHLHTDTSNSFTTMDSVTKYKMYIEKAKELGMTSLAFSEHGHCMQWYQKKSMMEDPKFNMKYIHAVEAYVTKTLEEKVRDNYHVVLIAKNFDGFKEINKLMSHDVAGNRNDGHFYYNPRITFDELCKTSDNIIITTACLGGILNSNDLELEQRFIAFLSLNSHRCFLEIQHHNVADQINYNIKLKSISDEHKIPLIAGTDTHSLDSKYAEGRIILQKAKNIHFENEEGWDLTFKSYDEVIEAYLKQNSIPMEYCIEALRNTNVMSDMVEPFTIDKSIKYPKIYKDSEKELKNKINKQYSLHPYVSKHDKDIIKARVKEEFEVYGKTNTIDFMSLESYLRDWEVKNKIWRGVGRGSVSGSMIAYILGITEMDSIKFDLNFFRFMNPSRVTNADIDVDYSSHDRDLVKQFLLRDKLNIKGIQTSEIITFNTIAKKGAIRDVGRALEMPLHIVNDISNEIESKEEYYRKEYPNMFEYVDLLSGVIVSVGTHPAGVLVTDRDISTEIGTCSLGTTDYPVSVLDMKPLDEMMYVKLDILGLDNVGVINDTCKLANIEKLTPDNIDLEDWNVWKSMREDTTSIFQWESQSAQQLLSKLFSDETVEKIKSVNKNLKFIKLFSFGNGLIRPGCASFRDRASNGDFYDNGLEELNTFLADELGYLTMQETLMKFLVKFCGYSDAESDNVRRAVAKKKGTEHLLPEIERRFVEYTSNNYNISKERCEEVIKPFLQVVLDSQSYAFSWNHSDAYSCIGYMCGYLRYYYPLEFLTASLNIFMSKEEKTASLIDYAKRSGITIESIKFGHSKSMYTLNAEENTIYKNMPSVKFINERVSNELYALYGTKYKDFFALMVDITHETSLNSKQLDVLIKLGYFSRFGKAKKLLNFVEFYDKIYGKKQFSKDNLPCKKEFVVPNSEETEKQYRNINDKAILQLVWEDLANEDIPLTERIKYEKEYLGYVDVVLPNFPKSYAIVVDIEKKFTHPMVTLYRIATGESEKIKVKNKYFDQNPFELYDCINTIEKVEENKWTKVENKFVKLDSTEEVLKKWTIIQFSA